MKQHTHTKEKPKTEKGTTLNLLGTFIILIGGTLHFFTTSQLLAIGILLIGMWLCLWAYYSGYTYTFLAKRPHLFKKLRFFYFIFLIIVTPMLLVFSL